MAFWKKPDPPTIKETKEKWTTMPTLEFEDWWIEQRKKCTGDDPLHSNWMNFFINHPHTIRQRAKDRIKRAEKELANAITCYQTLYPDKWKEHPSYLERVAFLEAEIAHLESWEGYKDEHPSTSMDHNSS